MYDGYPKYAFVKGDKLDGSPNLLWLVFADGRDVRPGKLDDAS